MDNSSISNIELSIKNTAWELWRQHYFWLKELLTSILCNFYDIHFVKQRLFDNVQDFINFFIKYYGYYNSKTLESLFKNNISVTMKLMEDIKAGDTKSADADRIEWYKNADEIADFLSGVNRYWDKQEWQTLIYDHLKLIENEAINRLNKQCATLFVSNEQIDNNILKLSNYTAYGIIRQFNI